MSCVQCTYRSERKQQRFVVAKTNVCLCVDGYACVWCALPRQSVSVTFCLLLLLPTLTHAVVTRRSVNISANEVNWKSYKVCRVFIVVDRVMVSVCGGVGAPLCVSLAGALRLLPLVCAAASVARGMRQRYTIQQLASIDTCRCIPRLIVLFVGRCSTPDARQSPPVANVLCVSAARLSSLLL
jgi:hypothetical protein